MLQHERHSPEPVAGGPPTGFLNPRDLELLGYLAAGDSTAQVAAAMRVSRNTARTRVRRLQAKVGAAERAQILHRTRELGVL
jgi:DNA-binding CsgD family transcriptional regulator